MYYLPFGVQPQQGSSSLVSFEFGSEAKESLLFEQRIERGELPLWRTASPNRPWAGLLSGKGGGSGVLACCSRDSRALPVQHLCACPATAILNQSSLWELLRTSRTEVSAWLFRTTDSGLEG